MPWVIWLVYWLLGLIKTLNNYIDNKSTIYMYMYTDFLPVPVPPPTYIFGSHHGGAHVSAVLLLSCVELKREKKSVIND